MSKVFKKQNIYTSFSDESCQGGRAWHIFFVIFRLSKVNESKCCTVQDEWCRNLKLLWFTLCCWKKKQRLRVFTEAQGAGPTSFSWSGFTPLRDKPWTDRSKRRRQVRRSRTSPWQFHFASRRISRDALENTRPCSKESKPNVCERCKGKCQSVDSCSTTEKPEEMKRGVGKRWTRQVDSTAIIRSSWLILITSMFCFIFDREEDMICHQVTWG